MKLTPAIQEKWAFRVNNYKMNNKVTFPPFIELVPFIREQASVRNDPTLMVNNNLRKHTSQRSGTTTKKVSVNKSDVSDDVNSTSNSMTEKWCPYHRKKHSLNECRAFRLKSHQERKRFLKSNNNNLNNNFGLQNLSVWKSLKFFLWERVEKHSGK